MFSRRKNEVVTDGPLTVDSLRAWMLAELSARTGTPVTEIDPDATFDSFGLDSRTAVQVSGRLEKVVERRLSPAVLFEHPSVNTVVTYLASELNLEGVSTHD